MVHARGEKMQPYTIFGRNKLLKNLIEFTPKLFSHRMFDAIDDSVDTSFSNLIAFGGTIKFYSNGWNCCNALCVELPGLRWLWLVLFEWVLQFASWISDEIQMFYECMNALNQTL